MRLSSQIFKNKTAGGGGEQGFTVIELVVVIFIMGLFSVLIFGNQSSYSGAAELKNIAESMGLSLRQAQVYGVSVKEFSPGAVNSFNAGYGLSFNLNAPPSGGTDGYIFFADRKPSGNGNPNGLYDSGWSCPLVSTSECLDKVTFSSGSYISNLCSISLTNVETCGNTSIDITFVRPNIEAKVFFNGNSDPNDPQNSGMKGARIELTSKDGLKHNSVVVYTTGQISIR